MRQQGGVAYTKGDVDGHANDTGLPGASLSSRARFAELWCKHGSARRSEEGPPHPTIKRCTFCKKGDYVPQSQDVPRQLRHLKPKVIVALRPLDIDGGVHDRAEHGKGYRVHTSMMSFAWSSEAVVEKIAQQGRFHRWSPRIG